MFHQGLVEVLDGEALVALAIEPLHFLRPIGRNKLARRLAEPPVDKAGLAFLLVAARPSPERSNVDPEQIGRLLLIELRLLPAVQKISKTSPCHTLKGSRPAHPKTPKKRRRYRTDRALPNPDISCATDKKIDIFLTNG